MTAKRDDDSWKDQLRQMDELLSIMIVAAYGQQDHLLIVRLCDAHAEVVARYAKLASR